MRFEASHADRGARRRLLLVIAADAIEDGKEMFVALVDVVSQQVSEIAAFLPEHCAIALVYSNTLNQ